MVRRDRRGRAWRQAVPGRGHYRDQIQSEAAAGLVGSCVASCSRRALMEGKAALRDYLTGSVDDCCRGGSFKVEGRRRQSGVGDWRIGGRAVEIRTPSVVFVSSRSRVRPRSCSR
jgi:hypothetical protein